MEKKRDIMDNEKYSLIVNNISEGIIIIQDNKFVYVNDVFCQITGYSKDKLINMPFTDIIPSEEDNKNLKEKLKQDLNKENIPDSFEFTFKNKNRKIKILRISRNKINYKGRPADLAVVFDITQYKEMENKLRNSKKILETILQNMPGGTLLIGKDYKIYKVNARTCEITGYSENELIGSFCDIICPKGSTSKKCPIWEEGKNEFQGMDTAVKCKDGHKNPVLKNAKRIDIDGKKYILENFQDITETKNKEEQIKYLCFHDQLTNLYNRRFFENEIIRLNDSRKFPISIMVADIDRLKYINDIYGHKMGDRYIKQAAKIFLSATRNEDIVAKIGGDEYAVILPGIDSSSAEIIKNRITEEFKKFNQNSKLPEELKVSIGYSTLNKINQDLNNIFEKADQNMYKNKFHHREIY